MNATPTATTRKAPVERVNGSVPPSLADLPIQSMQTMPSGTGAEPSARPRTSVQHILKRWWPAAALPVVIAAALVFYFRRVRVEPPPDAPMAQAVVQIRCGNSLGSGFFVQVPGHEELAHVVTARHVIASGDPISVIRWHPNKVNNTNSYYPVTYGATVVAASSFASDLALIRLSNVPKGVGETLELYTEPVSNGRKSDAFGFPSSDLTDTETLGLVGISGEVMSLNKRASKDPMDVTTEVYAPARIYVMTNSVGQGTSGGPLLLQGTKQVIGIISRADRANNQYEATDVSELASLLKEVKDIEPSKEEVEKRVREVVDEYLVPNSSTRFEPFIESVYLADSPHLRRIARDIAVFMLSSNMSGFAIWQALFRTTEEDFQNIASKSIRETVTKCISNPLNRFLFERSNSGSDCERELFRPLAFDLMKSHLRFKSGMSAANYTVKSVSPRARNDDASQPVWRATVATPDATFDILVVQSEGRLWLPLFDQSGNLTSLMLAEGSTAIDQHFSDDWIGAKVEYTPVGIPKADPVPFEVKMKIDINTNPKDEVSGAIHFVHQDEKGNTVTCSRYFVPGKGNVFKGRLLAEVQGKEGNCSVVPLPSYIVARISTQKKGELAVTAVSESQMKRFVLRRAVSAP
jgi:hypothetical protein